MKLANPSVSGPQSLSAQNISLMSGCNYTKLLSNSHVRDWAASPINYKRTLIPGTMDLYNVKIFVHISLLLSD